MLFFLGIGRIKLDIIRSELQDTLSSAEANLLHTAIRAEQLIDANDSREAIERLILDQRESLLLCMFTDTISAQPEIMDDYERAVRWLNSIASHYLNISACYMVDPYAEIPVIMNTGWIPGEDERPETRPWYRETGRAANHFNISAP